MVYHPENPDTSQVLNHLEALPCSGILSQASDGMIYLDIADDWIFKSLEVLRNFGYQCPPFFVFPPAPVGSHIKVITRREAEDYELVGGHVVPDIPEIGQKFEFEVVSAYPSYPRKRSYGVESRYKLKIECPELERIRRDLTGLAKPSAGFFICVGVRLEGEEVNLDLSSGEKLSNLEKEDEEDFEEEEKNGPSDGEVAEDNSEQESDRPEMNEMNDGAEGSEVPDDNTNGRGEPAQSKEAFWRFLAFVAVIIAYGLIDKLGGSAEQSN